MVTYDLEPLQDFFSEQASPKEVVLSLYKLMANYAKSVDAEHFEDMKDDISFLSFFVEYIDSISELKNQSPKV